MKITTQNEKLLILKDSNIIGTILGSLFILIGLVLIKPDILNIQTNAPLIMAIVFILLGTLIVLLPTRDSVIFNKESGYLTIKHKGVFLKGSDECPLGMIEKIKLLIISQGSSISPMPLYQLACFRKDGKEVVLNPSKSSFSSSRIGLNQSTDVPARKVGQTIAEFLNVPFNEENRSRYQDSFYRQHRPNQS